MFEKRMVIRLINLNNCNDLQLMGSKIFLEKYVVSRHLILFSRVMK